MSKSTYTYDNGLGCGCGCSKPAAGLGESPVEQKNQEADATRVDLLQTAKDYINDEIPFRYKAGAFALGLGFLWLRSRRRP